MTRPSVYQQLVAAGCEIDHHESDLYVRVTPEARAIVFYAAIPGVLVKPFLDSIRNEAWLEIPFAYDPYWEGV